MNAAPQKTEHWPYLPPIRETGLNPAPDENSMAQKDHSFYSTVPAMMHSIDRNGNIENVSDLWLLKLGYARNEVIGRKSTEFLTETSRKYALETVLPDFFKNGECSDVHYQFLKKDGGTIDGLLSAKSERDAEGGIIRSIAVIVDITERVKAEAELLIRENQFKGAFKNSAIGMTLVSPDGKIKEANRQFCEIVGYEMSEVLGLAFRDITHPDDVEIGEKHVRELISGEKQSFTIEKRYLHKTGAPVWVLLAVSKVTDKNDNIIHFIAQVQNITERKKADQRLREQAALLDVVPDAIFMRDMADRYIFWNKGAEKMYGYRAEEILGTTYQALRGGDRQDEFERSKKILLEKGEWSGELWLNNRAGKALLIQSRWTLIRDSEGNPTAVLATNTDITEKRSLEKQLLRSQRLESIGTLASGIAHDLNNLLTPVVLGMELLKIRIHDEAGRHRIDSLVSIVQRGSGLVQQLLSFAKGKDGHHEPINVKYIIDDAVKFVRETFPRKIDVQVNVSKEGLMVLGDATQVNQIIMNLLINARDAMEDHGGTLTISATRIVADEHLLRRYVDASPGRYVAITVRDTGAGIPPELHEKVFEPFFTTKEIGKGTGIGLTTVFSIVRNHKGFITLYSDVGNGSAFTIYLPVCEQTEESTVETATEKSASIKNECILLVDDEEIIRTIAADMLTSFGYRVITAINGEEALALYTQNQNDVSVVITDVMMPVMDGIELLKELKKLDPGVKVIATSGLMHGKNITELREGGVTAVLSKPYSVDSLLNSIREALTDKNA